jgi:hypothetical protein
MKLKTLRTVLGVFPAVLLTCIAQSAGTFTSTGNMTTPREGHSATLLTNGKVLITGGEVGSNALIPAELYDPDSGVCAPTGNMTTPRALHTAALLPDGTVVMAGGSLYAGVGLATAELYDPVKDAFTATGNMTTARGDRRVLC